MAGKEGAPKSVIDKTLDAWQKWNKFTLGIEGAAIVGGLAFGVPLLVGLGAAGATVDAVQIVAVDELQARRKKKQEGVVFTANEHKQAA